MLVAASAAGADGPAGVPVMIGGDAEGDACGSVGRVAGLDPGGALSVRAGPGVHYRRVDVVRPGQLLYVCGTDDGWLSVVYPVRRSAGGAASAAARSLDARPDQASPDARGSGDPEFSVPGSRFPATGDVDCGVATPVAEKRPYTGPCAHGWVSEKYVELIAG